MGKPPETDREVIGDALPVHSESEARPHLLEERLAAKHRSVSTASVRSGSSLVTETSAPDSRAPNYPDLGIRPYLKTLVRYRVLVLGCIALTMTFTTTRLLLAPRMYVAKATILPSRGQGSAGVMGLIASFAGTSPMGALTEESSSLLFPSILESRAVGLEVLEARYRFPMDGHTVETTLQEHLQAKKTDDGLKVLAAIRSFDVNKESGLLTVSARTASAELSTQIVNHFVDSLERINMEMHRATATLNRSFVQERLEQSIKDLSQAEERLTTFRQQNVRMSSPELELELLRLERDVTLKSQLYVTLSSQAEVARIEEAKDLPMVRVLDRAAVPELPEPTPKISSLVIGLIAGVLVSLMAVSGAECFRYLRRELALCTGG